MHMKKFLLSSFAVCAGLAVAYRLSKPAAAKTASKSSSYDAIDAYVEQEMRRLNIPGASLAIVEGDQVTHLRGFGHALPGGPPPAPQTPFVLGSTTKSFTALAVMQLVEAGKIELDAPVQRYLPWFRVADARASTRITVRHLLNQTSGLPEWPGEFLLADFDDRPDAAERQLRALSALKLNHPVGSAWEYSNLNYNLLGLVIEAASGESYADYIQKHIFTPLEMNHSYTAQAEAKKNGLAVGHRHWFSFPFAVRNIPIPRGSLAGGYLISSSEDLAHYLIAYLNGGRYGNTQILSPESIEEMHRGAAEVMGMGVSIGQYGMGWFVSGSGQTKTPWHTGTVPEYSSFIGLRPDQKKGIVLLINVDHYAFPPVMAEFGLNLTALAADEQLPPSTFGILRLIPWTMRALLLIPLVQIIGVAATLRRLRRWGRDPGRQPSGARMWGQEILLPLIPNLSLAALPIYLQVRGMLRYRMLFNPDVSWIALICGGFAGIWALVRTVLILHTLQNPKSREPVDSTREA